MSLFRPGSLKVIYTAGFQIHKAAAPSTSRCLSQTTSRSSKSGSGSDPAEMQSTEDQASLVTQESPSEPAVSHQPDYGARVDHGTS